MPFTNDRGQYGRPIYIGAEVPGRSLAPWIVGGVGLAVVALIGANAVAKRPQVSAHEKEVRAWETEFPGLPWRMDEVKDSRQLDMWERARDYWERKR